MQLPNAANDPSAASPSLIRELKETAKELRKPSNWRRRSTAPFFKERFALEIKAELDKMASDPDKNDKMFFYSEWEKYYKPNTLYVYINQSMRYLVEYLDPDETYRRFIETIGIMREKGKGIRLFFHRDIKGGLKLEATAKTVVRGKPAYMTKIDEWLDEAEEGAHLHIGQLALSDDEVKRIEESFAGVEGVQHNITNNDIKLLKITL